MEPLVSIVIPCYNHAEELRHSLDACLAQDYENIEIVAVDDCSTDNTYEVLKEYRKKNSLLRIYKNKKNMNEPVTRNRGMKLSKGEYIVYMDDDDMMTGNSISVRLDVFKKHPGTEVVCGYTRVFKGDRTYSWCERHKLKKFYFDFPLQGLMVRRSVHEKYGLLCGFLEYRSERELIIRLGLMRPEKKQLCIDLPRVNFKKVKECVAFYRTRKERYCKNNPNKKREKALFYARFEELRKNGLTRENTEFLKCIK